MDPTTLRTKSDNLWQSAVASLSDDVKANIDSAQDDKHIVLTELLKSVENAKNTATSKAWSFSRKNGDKVIVRDVLAKVVKWIDHFKHVGDMASQYDPVHAALPWAAVRFLLDVAIRDINKRGALLEKLATVSELICRNALAERTLKECTEFEGWVELRSVLVKLYTNILIFLGEARAYYMKGKLGIIGEHISLTAEYIDTAFTNVFEADKCVSDSSIRLNLEVHLATHSLLKLLHDKFDGPPDRRSETLEHINDQLKRAKRTAILRWVSTEPYKKHHKQTREGFLDGTGEWLLRDPVYANWKDQSASSFLWLHGIPGSGKSKLISAVIEDGLETSKRAHTPAPLWFYCSRSPSEPSRSQPARIMAAIAKQLMRPTGAKVLQPAISLYEKHEREDFSGGPLTLDEGRDLILELLQYYRDTTIVIVIDALDECDKGTRRNLLETLENLLQQSPCLLKIFVSSRDDQDIVCKLQSYPTLDLTSECNNEDIDKFVRSEVERRVDNGDLLRGSPQQKQLQSLIIQALTSKARGMFRWAGLQIAELCRQNSDEAVEERLGKLPEGLAELYQEIIQRIQDYSAEADKHYAYNTFNWLLCAQTTLSSRSILRAVCYNSGRNAQEIGRDQLLGLCCNLVVYDKSLDTFRFSHLSVREYLEGLPHHSQTLINTFVAEASLFNLMEHSFVESQSEWMTTRDSLEAYWIAYWPLHAQRGSPEKDSRLLKLMTVFIQDEQDSESYINRWVYLLRDPGMRELLTLRAYRFFMPDLGQPTSLWLICAFDFDCLLSADIWQNWGKAAGVGEREKHISRFGSFRVLEWCLLQDVQLRITGPIVYKDLDPEIIESFTTLLLTKRNSSVEFTESAVESSALYLSQSKMALLLNYPQRNIQITESVFIFAATNRYHGEGMLSFLLSVVGDDFRVTKDIIKQSVKNSSCGKAIVSLLLDRAVSDFRVTEDIVNAAIRNKNSEIVSILLDKAGSSFQVTEALVKAAAWNNNESTVSILLDRAGSSFQVTEAVVKIAVGQKNAIAVSILLDRAGSSFQVTESIIKTATSNSSTSMAVMSVLLDRELSNVTLAATLFVTATIVQGNEEKLVSLLRDKRQSELLATDEDVLALTEYCPSSGYTILTTLHKTKDLFALTILNLANADSRLGNAALSLALHPNSDVPITESTIPTMATLRPDKADKLVSQLIGRRYRDTKLPEEIVCLIIAKFGQLAVWSLLNRTSDMAITKAVVDAAAENKKSSYGIMKLLLKSRKQETIMSISESACAAAENCGRKDTLRLLRKCLSERASGN